MIGIPEILNEILINKLPIKEGEIFNQEEYLHTKSELEKRLHDYAYAFATVRGRVFVYPKEHRATISFNIDPGPISEFGEIEVKGLRNIEPKKVRDVFEFKKGDIYDPKKIRETQESIYGLGVFSLVKITPIISDAPEREQEKIKEEGEEEDDILGGLFDDAQENAINRLELDPVVPIRITLSEAKLWNVRAGVGAAAEKSRQDIHLRLDWASRNFLGGLRRLEHFNTLGYAWAPSIFTPENEARNSGLIANSVLRFTQPKFIEKKTSFELKLAVDRDIGPGFSSLSPSAKFGVRRKFFRHLTVDLSYNFLLYFLSDINASLRHLDIQDQNVHEYFEQRFLLDYRDDVLNPSKGFSIGLRFQESRDYLGFISPTIGGDFDYFKPSIDIEAYWPLVNKHIILAIRANAASIYNLGRDKRPPLLQKLFAGGTGSIRAFGRHELSPYTYIKDPVPIGGLTKAEAAFEARFRMKDNFLDVGDLWFAPFVDASTVLRGPYIIDSLPGSIFNAGPVSTQELLSSMLFDVGFGAWWMTAIGPIRMDFAYRLSSIENDSRFRRCAATPRRDGTCPNQNFVPLHEDEIQKSLSRFNFLLGIGHSF